MIAIRAENVYLDLPKDISEGFFLTRQSRDLKDWSQRNSDFTKLVEVPRTPKNNEALLPYIQAGVKEIPGNVEIEGISLDQRTKLLVNTFDNDKFSLSIIFDNQRFFSQLQGNLKDIDLDDLEFEWTTTGINGIKDTTDIVFAYAHWFGFEDINTLVHTGNTSFLTRQEINGAGFFIYVKELFSRIATAAGLTLDDSNISGNDLYNNTALPCPVDTFLDPDLVSVSTEKVSSSANVDYTSSGSKIQFDTVDEAGDSIFDTTSDTEYDFTSDGNVIVNAYISGFFLDLEINQDFQQPTLRLMRNGNPIVSFILTQSNQSSFFVSISENIYVENGDELYIQLIWGKGDNVGITINAGSWFKIRSRTQDATISVNEFLPEMSKAEFVKGVLNHTNLLPVLEDTTLKLYDFDSIFNNDQFKPEILEDKEQRQSYTFPNIFKLSKINYKKPPQPLNRTDINGFFRVNDESLPDEGIILELPFEGCDIVNTSYNGNTNIPLIDAYQIESFNYDGINASSGTSTFTLDNDIPFKEFDFLIVSSEVKRIETKTSSTAGTVAGTWVSTYSSQSLKLIRVKKRRNPPKLVYIEDASNFTIFDKHSGASQVISSGKKASFGENMLLGTILENEYNQLIQAMKFPKILNVWIKIPGYQVMEKDLLRKIIYIDKYNERYYINKLEQWKPFNQLCRAELIRIR